MRAVKAVISAGILVRAASRQFRRVFSDELVGCDGLDKTVETLDLLPEIEKVTMKRTDNVRIRGHVAMPRPIASVLVALSSRLELYRARLERRAVRLKWSVISAVQSVTRLARRQLSTILSSGLAVTGATLFGPVGALLALPLQVLKVERQRGRRELDEYLAKWVVFEAATALRDEVARTARLGGVTWGKGDPLTQEVFDSMRDAARREHLCAMRNAHDHFALTVAPHIGELGPEEQRVTKRLLYDMLEIIEYEDLVWRSNRPDVLKKRAEEIALMPPIDLSEAQEQAAARDHAWYVEAYGWTIQRDREGLDKGIERLIRMTDVKRRPGDFKF